MKGNNRNYTTVDFASTGRTLYSLESVLFWPNISRADAGKYNCLADGQHIGHTRLEVQEVVLPFLNITNMKNQTREPLEGTDLELICGMCGLPKVSLSPSPSPHPSACCTLVQRWSPSQPDQVPPHRERGESGGKTISNK